MAEQLDTKKRLWFCKVGETGAALPTAADGPMRDAIAAAYKQITGEQPTFIFSGWGGELTEAERWVVDDVPPDEILAIEALRARTQAPAPSSEIAEIIAHFRDEEARIRKEADYYRERNFTAKETSHERDAAECARWIAVLEKMQTAPAPSRPSEVRVPESEWRWYGNAAHFICGRWCRFHLATKVGDLLVSTVGEYMPTDSVQTILAEQRGFPLTQRGDAREAEFLKKNGGYELLGAWGRYETMVFAAGAPCATETCGCGLPAIDGSDLGGERYDDAKSATDGHYRYCEMAATGSFVSPLSEETT